MYLCLTIIRCSEDGFCGEIFIMSSMGLSIFKWALEAILKILRDSSMAQILHFWSLLQSLQVKLVGLLVYHYSKNYTFIIIINLYRWKMIFFFLGSVIQYRRKRNLGNGPIYRHWVSIAMVKNWTQTRPFAFPVRTTTYISPKG